MPKEEVPVQIRKHVLKKLREAYGPSRGGKIKSKGEARKIAPGRDASPGNKHPEARQEEEVDVKSPDQDDNHKKRPVLKDASLELQGERGNLSADGDDEEDEWEGIIGAG